MAWAFYKKETETISQKFGYTAFRGLNRRDTVDTVKEICRSYDIDIPAVVFTCRTWCRCDWKKKTLRFKKSGDTHISVIAHEAAHWILHCKKGHHRHDNALMNLIMELIRFIIDLRQ